MDKIGLILSTSYLSLFPILVWVLRAYRIKGAYEMEIAILFSLSMHFHKLTN